jgi:hypothetical protein
MSSKRDYIGDYSVSTVGSGYSSLYISASTYRSACMQYAASATLLELAAAKFAEGLLSARVPVTQSTVYLCTVVQY